MTIRPVRIGLQVQPQHAAYAAIRETATEAERLGVDVIFNWDHFFPLDGPATGFHFECWTTLAAWAESTRRVEIGALVSCNGYRNPELLADMARTVDHISQGRLILGIGSGWCEKDFVEYGYDFGTPGGRIADLADALPRIRGRLSRLNPPPMRRLPVLIGGGGERKTLRLVARYADIWHDWGTPEGIERKAAVLRRHCADLGRDSADIEIATGVAGGPSVTGEPEVLGPRLRAAGVSLFTVGASGPEYDLSTLRRWIAWRDRVNPA
jgi:probable F420-dependent oxidoreductase